jgi:hypothetical protein
MAPRLTYSPHLPRGAFWSSDRRPAGRQACLMMLVVVVMMAGPKARVGRGGVPSTCPSTTLCCFFPITAPATVNGASLFSSESGPLTDALPPWACLSGGARIVMDGAAHIGTAPAPPPAHAAAALRECRPPPPLCARARAPQALAGAGRRQRRYMYENEDVLGDANPSQARRVCLDALSFGMAVRRPMTLSVWPES